MNAIQVFENPEFGSFEVAVINGKKHIEAIPCARALGYVNPRKAVLDHCRYVTKRDAPHPQSPGKTITKNFIPQGDVYRLIARSNLPEAVRFESWIFDEVLVDVMETGSYISSNSAFYRLQYENTCLQDENQRLRERVQGLASGYGSFQLWDVAQQLRKSDG